MRRSIGKTSFGIFHKVSLLMPRASFNFFPNNNFVARSPLFSSFNLYQYSHHYFATNLEPKETTKSSTEAFSSSASVHNRLLNVGNLIRNMSDSLGSSAADIKKMGAQYQEMQNVLDVKEVKEFDDSLTEINAVLSEVRDKVNDLTMQKIPALYDKINEFDEQVVGRKPRSITPAHFFNNKNNNKISSMEEHIDPNKVSENTMASS